MRRLMPESGLGGITIRPMAPPGRERLTLAYIDGLVNPGDLQKMLLSPVARGLPPGGPEDLAASGRIPAPALRVAADGDEVLDALLSGQACLHVEGYGCALLAGTGGQPQIKEKFQRDLTSNLLLLRRISRRPELRLEVLRDIQKGRSALAYFEGRAQPDLVNSVRRWAEGLSPRVGKTSLWNGLVGIFRLPPAVECFKTSQVLEAMERGHVVVLAEQMPFVLLAPTTAYLLLSGGNDHLMYRPLRRVIYGPRLAAVVVGLFTAAWYVAVSSYHHSLLPGPFLMALSAVRRNLPFPAVLEVTVIQLIADTLWIGGLRMASRGTNLLAFIGVCLTAMVMMQSGLAAPVSAWLGVGVTATLMVIPTLSLDRFLRAWRYLLIGAAAGLGIYGIAVLTFIMMAYVSGERPFGHPLWRHPAVNSS